MTNTLYSRHHTFFCKSGSSICWYTPNPVPRGTDSFIVIPSVPIPDNRYLSEYYMTFDHWYHLDTTTTGDGDGAWLEYRLSTEMNGQNGLMLIIIHSMMGNILTYFVRCSSSQWSIITNVRICRLVT